MIRDNKACQTVVGALTQWGGCVIEGRLPRASPVVADDPAETERLMK